MKKNKKINNAFYNTLNKGWYELNDHPVTLLRAENKIRNPWIQNVIQENFPSSCKILDMGCGAGFLTNELVKQNHEVTGIDISEQSLEIAKKNDSTKKVKYIHANVYDVPLENCFFDVVCAMDLLEHVEDPQKVLREAHRLLKPNGMFFFHTFNKNILSYLLIIKAVDWFIPNAIENMHVYSLFIKPKNLKFLLKNTGFIQTKILGFHPKIFQKSLLKLIFTRKLNENFLFTFSKNTFTGYSGFTKKEEKKV